MHFTDKEECHSQVEALLANFWRIHKIHILIVRTAVIYNEQTMPKVFYFLCQLYWMCVMVDLFWAFYYLIANHSLAVPIGVVRTLLTKLPFPFRSVTEHDWWRQSNSCLLLRSLSMIAQYFMLADVFPGTASLRWGSDQTPLNISHYVQIIAKSRVQREVVCTHCRWRRKSKKKKKARCDQTQEKIPPKLEQCFYNVN